MLSILLAAVLVGPIENVHSKQIYILVDSTSKNEDTRRNSLIIKNELKSMDWIYVPERIYTDIHFKVTVEELVDKDKPYPAPSFKFRKNGTYQKFCPGTFSASGSFTLAFASIIQWEMYFDELLAWRQSNSVIVSVRRAIKKGKWTTIDKDGKKTESIYDNIICETFWKHQPPNRPRIFPKGAYDFYEYKNLIFSEEEQFKEEIIYNNIQTPPMDAEGFENVDPDPENPASKHYTRIRKAKSDAELFYWETASLNILYSSTDLDMKEVLLNAHNKPEPKPIAKNNNWFQQFQGLLPVNMPIPVPFAPDAPDPIDEDE